MGIGNANYGAWATKWELVMVMQELGIGQIGNDNAQGRDRKWRFGMVM